MEQPIPNQTEQNERAPDGGESAARAAVRKRARQRLRRAQALVEHSSDILFIVDARSNPIYVSPVAGRILGYAQDRPLGLSTLDLLHPEDAAQTAEALAYVMAEGRRAEESILVRTRTVDGGYRFLELRAHSMLDDPDVEGVLVSARDVTDQKRAEEELRRSEHRFRSVVQNSSDMILLIDAHGTISYVSPASERILGMRIEELVGTSVMDLVHPDDLTVATVGLERTLRHGGTYEPLSMRALHAEGRWVDTEVVSNNLLDDPEVNGIVVNVRDVTERRRMAAELEHTRQRLVEAFEHAAVGMALIDLNGRYTKVNGAMCEMLGYEEEELLGRSYKTVTHPEENDHPVARAEAALSGTSDTYHVEKRYVHRDGHVVWASVGVTIVRDDEGVPQYFVSQAIDVTARRMLEERLAHEAVHDTLTGLPTRSLLFDRLDQALAGARRREALVAVLFVDLDGFKAVNDSLGHAAGDQVLVAVAQRLRDAVREIDTPARFGGDEFVVICPDLSNAAGAVGIAERIRAALCESITVTGAEVCIDASVGIAIADGNADGDTLLREADSATYCVKRRGGGGWEIAPSNSESRCR